MNALLAYGESDTGAQLATILVALLFGLVGLLIATKIVTHIAYDTVRSLRERDVRRDAKRAERAAAKAAKAAK